MYISNRPNLLTPKAIKSHLEKAWQGYITGTPLLPDHMHSHLQFLTIRFDVSRLSLPVGSHSKGKSAIPVTF
jgi:hypothetical protein